MLSELQKIARDMLFLHGYLAPWAGYRCDNASPRATSPAIHKNKRELVTPPRTRAFKSAAVDGRGDHVQMALEQAAPRNCDVRSAAGGRK